MTGLTVFTVFFLVFLHAGTCTSKKVKEVTVTRSKPRRLDITCKNKGAVTSSIDVTSGSLTNQCCVGKSPQMIVDVNNCYWKTSCSINFPTDIVIMPLDDKSQLCQGCIGSSVDKITLKEARCFTNVTNHEIVDICDETGSLTGNISMDTGILRSHPDYPWLYNSDTFYKFDRTSRTHVCKRTLWLGGTERKTNIAMKVQVVDIADGDFLNVTSVSMIGETTTETINTSMARVYQEHKSLEFTFNISQGTNGGMGFLICFKRFQTGNYDSKTDVCDELMEKDAKHVKIKRKKVKGNCPTVWGCRTRQGSRRGKGGKGKKRDKKNSKTKDKTDKGEDDATDMKARPVNTKTKGRKRSRNGGRKRNRKAKS